MRRVYCGVTGGSRFIPWFRYLWVAGITLSLHAQTGDMKPSAIVGQATAVDAGSRRLTIKPDSGDPVEVAVVDSAAILRAKPGATTLTDATPWTLEQIAVGDRVLVRGTRPASTAPFSARQVVVMTQADVSQKQDAERAEWRRRGVLGAVTAVAPDTGEITIKLNRVAPAQTLVIDASRPNVSIRRYPPDSVQFSDSRPSTLAEVRVGDQLRALGDKNAAGDRLTAEQVVFGTFRTVTGTVATVDSAGGQLTLRKENTKQAVTVVVVGAQSQIRRLTPELGARLARMGSRDETAPPAGAPASPAPERPWARGPGRGPGGGGEDLLERLPTTTLAELKPGDRILVASTEGTDPDRMNAIALVAGLETLVLPASGGGRGPRPAEIGLPAGLMELGMGIP